MQQSRMQGRIQGRMQSSICKGLQEAAVAEMLFEDRRSFYGVVNIVGTIWRSRVTATCPHAIRRSLRLHRSCREQANGRAVASAFVRDGVPFKNFGRIERILIGREFIHR